MLLNHKQFHRLFTHEDAHFYHAHKVLGMLILVHFMYRLGCIAFYGNSSFDNSYMTLLWIWMHMLLHISSFQFKLSPRRNHAYNIIWPEMRWHTMIFAYRTLAAMLIQYFTNCGYVHQSINNLSRIPIVLGTFLLADRTTYYFEQKGEYNKTTMRSNPYPSWVPARYIQYHNLFYSISQVLATMNILCYTDMGGLFLILIPIQMAPFFMTLVKKGITDQLGWHIYYTISLLINYMYGIFHNDHIIISSNLYWILVSYVVYCRFYLKMNKYIIWLVVLYFCCIKGNLEV